MALPPGGLSHTPEMSGERVRVGGSQVGVLSADLRNSKPCNWEEGHLRGGQGTPDQLGAPGGGLSSVQRK